ncbi:protein adenylyltransferase SelO [Paenibacillus massiliensis]|uniref:protein adenylyltransferase SelO n=1 Tax=Paenibacillus massiliensis TaxID=225917 RepID=UPI00046E8A19|nr:YdiU family protein [Paenibacillus massiliensis]
MTEKKIEASVGWNWHDSYGKLPELMYTRQAPTPVRAPELFVLNESYAATLGLEPAALRSEEAVRTLAGNEVPAGTAPLAQAYAGHQFGHFNRLGDGRALLLGEHKTPAGQQLDIQLKGSGRTPYSRGGDGRAALGPMLREYIISEAMHGLGIPTTRSLAVVTTGETILREQELPGAILTRVAASHIRVGTFQYAAAWGGVEDLRALADYTWLRHYSNMLPVEGQPRYLALLRQVIQRQAALIAQWQLVGFIHGVMNTDNMTLSGETIDYGPCAFMDQFDPATVFSSIDQQGRYAYGNQPDIALWNLARLAEALLPLLHEDEEEGIRIAQEALEEFPDLYQGHWLRGMRAKLGIFAPQSVVETAAENGQQTATGNVTGQDEPKHDGHVDDEHKEADEQLIFDLLQLMHKHHADYTNTFRALTLEQPVEPVLGEAAEYVSWYARWQSRLAMQQQTREQSLELMRSSNPAVIPRNHRVEEALAAAMKGDHGVMERLLDVLAKPYAYSTAQEEYTAGPPDSMCNYRTFCGT